MDKKTDNGAPKPQRKIKFMPKAPPRREKKLVLPKPEKVEDAEAEEFKAQELLKRFKEASNRPKFKAETKPSKTRVSSFSFGSTAKSGGADAATSGMPMKEYKEPWDYYKYYPVTLPIRMPYSGNPELLDEQEFKVDSETNAYNESSVKPAEELGLMEDDLEKKLIFIQLPTMMPLPKHSAKIEGGETASSSKPSKPTGPSSKACSLKELPSGFMGKMLVYKSGAVKMKLGNHLYNELDWTEESLNKIFDMWTDGEGNLHTVFVVKVDGGLDCTFAQDVVAINTEEKHCCNVGELNKRAIITPDIDSVLDNMEF